MEFRPLGNSGLTVSAFSLGSWLTYEFMEERDALAVISRAVEAGINFLDDARYDDRTGKAPLKSGYSEVVFGGLLRKGGWDRSKLIIANKMWLEFYPAQSLEEELDGSLGRLQMDYLDLVYCATPPASLPLIDILKPMDNLIRAGKVRHWGVLNWPLELIVQAHQLARAEGLSAPCAAQPAYSLLHKSPVEDPQTGRVFEEAGLGIVASYTLYGGLLSGKYNQASTAVLKGRFGAEKVEEMRQKGLLEKVEQVIQIAREAGCTPAQLAMAYCLKNPLVSSVLFGATKPTQIEDNLRALEILPRLGPELMERLRKI
jgi:aryl-alcohol dehydrogenase-like predicted oxidoreductase